MSPHHYSRSRGRARVHNTSIGSWARIESIRCEPRRSRLGLSISQEAMDFISACEALHLRVAQSGILTGEEIDLIEFSALDLLNRVKPLE
jgi:hypothetical protein